MSTDDHLALAARTVAEGGHLAVSPVPPGRGRARHGGVRAARLALDVGERRRDLDRRGELGDRGAQALQQRPLSAVPLSMVRTAPVTV